MKKEEKKVSNRELLQVLILVVLFGWFCLSIDVLSETVLNIKNGQGDVWSHVCRRHHHPPSHDALRCAARQGYHAQNAKDEEPRTDGQETIQQTKEPTCFHSLFSYTIIVNSSYRMMY